VFRVRDIVGIAAANVGEDEVLYQFKGCDIAVVARWSRSKYVLVRTASSTVNIVGETNNYDVDRF
jgi:hypothetical protein